MAPAALHPLGLLKGFKHGRPHPLEPRLSLIRLQIINIRPHAHLQSETFPFNLNGIQVHPVCRMNQSPVIINALHHAADSNGKNILPRNLLSLVLFIFKH